ncbi:MAG: heme-binding protein [Nitriliruptor sp.]|nr:MAG: heme-binding protein [Nitriliruptor sp.]
MTLEHRDAVAIIERVRDRLEDRNQAAAVAVCDGHGELIAFLRTDGCRLPSIDVAMNKAFTAPRQRTPSKELGESAASGQFFVSNYGGLRYLGWGGGVPIVHDDEVIGAVGVSGLRQHEAIEYAELGASMVTEFAGTETT